MSNMIKKGLYLTMISFVLFSCGEDVVEDPVDREKEDEIEVVTPEFEGAKFTNPDHFMLLEELNICDLVESDSSLVAACTPENFEIFKFRNDKEVKDAFIVQTKAGIVLKGESTPLPVRHLMVFEREAGKLVRVNGFRGEVVALEDNDSEIKDLISSFYFHDERAVFVCLFKWVEGKYSFDSVIGIDWNEGLKPIKEDMKDSISSQIYNDLMERSLIF